MFDVCGCVGCLYEVKKEGQRLDPSRHQGFGNRFGSIVNVESCEFNTKFTFTRVRLLGLTPRTATGWKRMVQV